MRSTRGLCVFSEFNSRASPSPSFKLSFAMISPASRSPRPLTPSMSLASSPAMANFQIERAPKSRSRRPSVSVGYDNEYLMRDNIKRLLDSKNHIFAVCGSIPLDASQLVLFFRTKSGISHTLDFPIDVEFNSGPPALDVLVAACRPHQSSLDGYAEQESLFFPLNLPLTTTLELGNHPIMDSIRDTLFPALPVGHYLTAMRDKLEVLVSGSRLAVQPRNLRSDGRVATLIITLPVRFRGGSMIVRDTEGHQQVFSGNTANGALEWTAFSADCEYEVNTVEAGCKMTISYSIFLKTFGASGVVAEPLITPSETFMQLLSPVLAGSRGRKVAFFVSTSYGVSPSEFLAESLVPYLKSGDSILYHALKLYKLTPELHWYAGGYIWPLDRVIEFSDNDSTVTPGLGGMPPVRGTFGAYGSDPAMDEAEILRAKVQSSGGISLVDADITILTDWDSPSSPVGKERVAFASGGDLDKLIVNSLIVVYVP
ncbi:hypothetical protein C8J56DRAFT_431028 [Mycena floridula]|nr:hypothetical protein C8J56DRAFT_431028 [Mycena floridula]